MPDAGAPLDNCILIVTPENIAFQYRVAGPFRRAVAYLCDLALQCIVFYTIFRVTVVLVGFGLSGIGIGLGLVLWFVASWFYGGLFETFWNGQTPGKRLLGIRVLRTDGRPINGMQAVLRNILRVVDQQPLFFCQLGFWAAAMNDRFQRLGDLACGTIVILEERQWFSGLTQAAGPEVTRLAASIPAGFEVDWTLSRVLAAYVQRRQTFPAERRYEIARHLADPLRQTFGLPPGTNPDLLLCGLYHRTFIADPHHESLRSPRRAAGPVAAARAAVR